MLVQLPEKECQKSYMSLWINYEFYLDWWRSRSGFLRSWSQTLYLIKPRREQVLDYWKGHTWLKVNILQETITWVIGDVWGVVLWESSSSAPEAWSSDMPWECRLMMWLALKWKAIMKRFSKLPSDGEEGISVGTSVCGVDVIANGWL